MFNTIKLVKDIKLNLIVTIVQTEASILQGFFNQLNLLIGLQCSL